MDKRILALRNWGCDITSALERMMDDEEFYLECLNDISKDKSFEFLIESLKMKDVNAAFDCAHMLKGVLANLGLTPMYKKTSEIVESIRSGNCDDLLNKAVELKEINGHLSRILCSP